MIIGLIVIGWSIFWSFNIFTAKTSAPEVFKFEDKAQDSSQTQTGTPTTLDELQKQMESAVSEQIKQLIPVELIYNLLNLISWAVFASFLVFAGFYIGSLGIKLIRR